MSAPGATWGVLNALCLSAAATEYVVLTSGSAGTVGDLAPELLVADAEARGWDIAAPWWHVTAGGLGHHLGAANRCVTAGARARCSC